MSDLTIDSISIELESNVKGADNAIKGLTSTLNNLKGATSANIKGLGNIGKLVSTTSKNGSYLSATFKNVSGNMQTTTTVTKKGTTQITKYTKEQNNLNNALKAFKAIGIGAIVRKLFNYISDGVQASSEYIANWNLFNTVMGETKDTAKDFVDTFSNGLGIDDSDVMRYMGAFKSLTDSFGMTSEASYTMSKNLTQLSYDLSAFKGISIEDAMQKLKSGISGEIEPMRAIGIALDEATLQTTAYSLGINKKVSAMTRAQKTELLYYQIMQKTAQAQGYFGKTLLTPQTALSTIKAQFTQLARAIGNIFIPILMAAIPYVKAITQVLTEAANAVASFFGFKIADYSISSGVENVTSGISGIGDAADDAKNKVKGMLAPFDELNTIDFGDGSGSSGTSSVSSGGSLGIPLQDYDALAGVNGEIEKKIEKIKDFLKESIKYVSAIGGAFLTWKIGSSVLNFFALFKEFNRLKANLALAGIATTIGGIVLLIQDIYKMIKNPSWDNFSNILFDISLILAGISVTLIAIKGLTLTSKITLAIAAISLLSAAIIKVVKKLKEEKTTVDRATKAQEAYNAAKEKAKEKEETYIDAIDKADETLKKLNDIQSQTQISGEELFKSVENGTKDYADFTEQEKEVYKAYIKNIDAQKEAKDATNEYMDAKKIEIKASIENQKVISQESKKYEDFKNSVIDAFNGGKITLEEARKTISNALVRMDEDTRKTFVEGLPASIAEGLESGMDPYMWNKFSSTYNSSFKRIGNGSGTKWAEGFKNNSNLTTEELLPTESRFKTAAQKMSKAFWNNFSSGDLTITTKSDGTQQVKVRGTGKYSGGFANGGVPEMGTLFYAGEAGPEWVGSIGNQTAVANSNQMTEVLMRASYEGMSQALRENQSSNKTEVYIGNDKVYSGYGRYQNRQANKYGVSTVTV